MDNKETADKGGHFAGTFRRVQKYLYGTDRISQ